MSRVVIVGGGFAGLNAAKVLGGHEGVEVLLVERHNHHLFSPLLYQVAMAGLSPADIAAPIRSMLSDYQNTRVVLAEVTGVDVARSVLTSDSTICCSAAALLSRTSGTTNGRHSRQV